MTTNSGAPPPSQNLEPADPEDMPLTDVVVLPVLEGEPEIDDRQMAELQAWNDQLIQSWSNLLPSFNRAGHLERETASGQQEVPKWVGDRLSGLLKRPLFPRSLPLGSPLRTPVD